MTVYRTATLNICIHFTSVHPIVDDISQISVNLPDQEWHTKNVISH